MKWPWSKSYQKPPLTEADVRRIAREEVANLLEAEPEIRAVVQGLMDWAQKRGGT